ncbi:stage III sporulation protein AB [Paenibacillus swuensis]|uniref:Stage III sporulation protein AB n=1 Tax=Paenibacillus swuensis TaxID=1178515 RepID=A0A172TM17_9BACL|nr:stage III sporulation protein SpoIIIAB [Paenibacillus swuensis]ANE48078.1 stage III sporulation protein AB [Paenibacillus swuensis]
MMKLLGAVIIIAAGTLFGFIQSAKYANRPKEIRELIQALQRLETEIHYGFTPLPEALTALSEQATEPLSSLFRTASEQLKRQGMTAAEAMHEAVKVHWGATSMGKAEQQVMRQLGHTLGVSDRDNQIKHLRLAMNQLQSEEELAREQQRRYESMWKSLGALGGALVAILMY